MPAWRMWGLFVGGFSIDCAELFAKLRRVEHLEIDKVHLPIEIEVCVDGFGAGCGRRLRRALEAGLEQLEVEQIDAAVAVEIG